jgi:predicted RNA-binding protein with PUA-like domain
MNFWLFKSEPDVFSFADLKSRPHHREPWSGVRNYQARNFMRDSMLPGDLGLFYHSSCPQPGVAGILRIDSEPKPDPSQFIPSDEYFDPKASPDRPIWQLVDVAWAADLPQFVSLDLLRAAPALADMQILRRGNRLSITPVTPDEFHHICSLGGLSPKAIAALS